MSDAAPKRSGPRPEPRTNLFSTVLDAMTDGVVVVDDRMRAVVTNRALRDMLLMPRPVPARPLSNWVANARLTEAFEAVLAGGGPRQVEVVHQGFVTRTLEFRVVPLPDHAYWGHRALGVARDVTERRAVERAQRDFVANASHELRTPTAAILGWAEALVEAPPSGPGRLAAAHEAIHRHARRLATLIDQLLDVCRIDERQWRFDPAPVDLGALASEVADEVAEAASAAGLSLTIACPAPPPALTSDASALRVVLGNLVQNAIKFTPIGGRVELRVEAWPIGGADGVRVAVVDSGIGIAQADQARIFERFFRVDGGRTRHTGGAGLGLAIVSHLVEHLGGALEVHSEVGRGSTFAVALPSAPRPRPGGS